MPRDIPVFGEIPATPIPWSRPTSRTHYLFRAVLPVPSPIAGMGDVLEWAMAIAGDILRGTAGDAAGTHMTPGHGGRHARRKTPRQAARPCTAQRSLEHSLLLFSTDPAWAAWGGAKINKFLYRGGAMRQNSVFFVFLTFYDLYADLRSISSGQTLSTAMATTSCATRSQPSANPI